MRIWHPEVHAAFGEVLYYYLLKIQPYDAEGFAGQLERLLADQGIGGCCYY